MIPMILAKIISLAIGIMYGFACVGSLVYKKNIQSPKVFLMAFGFAIFIVLQLTYH